MRVRQVMMSDEDEILFEILTVIFKFAATTGCFSLRVASVAPLDKFIVPHFCQKREYESLLRILTLSSSDDDPLDTCRGVKYTEIVFASRPLGSLILICT